MYKVVAILFKAGDQVPVIPLVEVIGNADNAAPEQIAETAANNGVTIGFTVMVKVAVLAHCPAVGVKVYKVVAVLFKAGDQEPVIPLVDVVGNGARTAPEQIAGTAVKLGVNTGSILIDIVVGVAEVHWPGFGVKVYGKVPKKAVLTTAGLQIPVIGVTLLELEGNVGATAP